MRFNRYSGLMFVLQAESLQQQIFTMNSTKNIINNSVKNKLKIEINTLRIKLFIPSK